MRAYRHVIPNGTYRFPRAIEGGNLLEYAIVCFRNDEDFGPSAQPLMQPIGRSCATFREMPARAQASTTRNQHSRSVAIRTNRRSAAMWRKVGKKLPEI